MAVVDLKRLITNNDRGLVSFFASKRKMVNSIEPGSLATLKQERQTVQESADG